MKQITKKQKEEVKEFYEKFISDLNLDPILIVESGSRMWEFASIDSDFDIRGIYLPSIEDYFSITKLKEQHGKIDDLMDIVMFSIDKYFKLLSQSNPNFLERLQSPIQYFNRFEEFGIDFNEFKKTVYNNINLKSLYHHYISMAHKNYEKYIKDDQLFTYKKCLYVLRSLFCTEYILKNKQVPPVIFKEVISEINIEKEYLDLIHEILDKKDKSQEKTQVENKTEVKKLLDNYFDKLNNTKMENTGDKIKLLNYLNAVAIKIKKKKYY